MEKIRITKAAARARFSKIFRVGANDLDFCGVSERFAVGYNAGVYGWNWDIMPIGGGLAICQGYRATIGERMPREIEERIEVARRAWVEAFNDFGAADRRERMEAASRDGARALGDLVKMFGAEG